MSQFDLIEKYVTNSLGEAERLSFEQEMKGDAQLKAEVDLQKEIIEGVKQARVAELKSMLNNVPVSGGYSLTTGQLALATLTAGIIGGILYISLNSETTQPDQAQQETKVEQSIEPSAEETAPAIEETKGVADEVKVKSKTEPKPKTKTKSIAKKENALPRVSAMDPTSDMVSPTEEAIETKGISRSDISASTVEVDTESGNKDYPFHYQFAKGKLHLFGPFDTGLYEIIEIYGGSHAIFLYYKDAYYHLDQKESHIVPLIQIRDMELLGKLEEYRGKSK